MGKRGIYTGVRMECEESGFLEQGWLAAWPSREFQPQGTERPVVLFCLVVLQLVWRFNFWHAWHVSSFWRLAAASHLRDSRESLFFLHTLEHFFTLSHSLPLQESYLNTGLLNAKIQANLARNKTNKMVDKIQPYINPKTHTTSLTNFIFQN